MKAFLTWLACAALFLLKAAALAGALLALGWLYAHHGMHADPGDWPLP